MVHCILLCDRIHVPGKIVNQGRRKVVSQFGDTTRGKMPGQGDRTRGALGSCQRVLFKRLEAGPELGSPGRLWTGSRKDVSIEARLILMDARIGSRSSSLPACSAIVASDRDCSLRTSCSLLSKGLGASFWRRWSTRSE